MHPSRWYICTALCLLLGSGCGPSERDRNVAAAAQTVEAEKAKLEQLNDDLRKSYARAETDQLELQAWVKQRGDELTKAHPPGDELKAKFAELLAESEKKRQDQMKRNRDDTLRIKKEIQDQTARVKAAEAAHMKAFAEK